MIKQGQFTALSMKNNFRDRVLAVVKTIPKGKTMTYKQVAKAAGSPRAYRAVGNILSTNYDPEIPCHRVIRSDGSPGGYNRGSLKKQKLLAQEKTPLKSDGRSGEIFSQN